MSGNEIAALIVAITGAISAIFLGVRNLRSDSTKAEVDKAAALLQGYDGIMERLEQENARLIAAQETMREAHQAEVQELHERIDELGAQVLALQRRLP